MTVLIVDDEAAIRDTLRDAFEDEGYAVAVAANGAEALERLAQNDISAVILDLIMPELDGNQLIREMQAQPALASIPVIVTTSDPSRAPPGILTMRKPANLEVLLDAVARSSRRVRRR